MLRHPCGVAALVLLLAGCAAPPLLPATGTTAAPATPAAACKDEDDWNEATSPRRIHGNTWYVGSCGITAVLITSPQGHVLIDGATVQAADGIARSIEATGTRLRDIRLLLNTHEHFDHAGGLARLQQLTGARVLARPAALSTLRSGLPEQADPQHGALKPMPAIPSAQPIPAAGIVQLGPLRLKMHALPGHAPGGTGWSWTSCDGRDCRHIVYADSVSAISDDHYRFDAHPAYVAQFRASMAALAAIAPCDILLTPHPGASALWPRLRGEQPMTTPGGCRALADTGLRNLGTRLTNEREGRKP